MKKNKVAIAMSGGVDSSTAAKIFKDKGYDCLGVFMRLGIERGCCDETAARAVCQKIGIKFYPVDMKRQFNREVKEYFLQSYEKGITPNPCVKCNQFIKFGALLKKARALDCDFLATGHYVKLKKIKNVYKIFRAKDLSKDQTYFLYNLTQKELKHLLFPLGDLIKEKIKAEAAREKLPNLKTESQDVCFMSGGHNEFLKEKLKMKKGPIKTLAGKIIGEHQGLPLYTIGQRKGVEIGGSGPYYVVNRDFKTNTLFVTDKSDDPALSGKSLIAENINWISGRPPKLPFKCSAVIRYRHPAVPCVVIARNAFSPGLEPGDKASRLLNSPLERGARRAGCVNNCKQLLIKFSQPQRAITPGQSAVFYKNNELLGGGVIV